MLHPASAISLLLHSINLIGEIPLLLSYRFFTYSVKRCRGRTALVSGAEAPLDRRHASALEIL